MTSTLKMLSLRKCRFLAEQAGGGAAEFALVALILVTLVLGIIDFGRLLWEYNRMEKAVQLGARFAVIHEMAAPGLENFDAIAAAGGNRLPVPISAVNPNPVICTWSGGKASCNGYGQDSVAFNAIVDEMRRAAPQIKNDDVTIQYEHIGCGTSGMSIIAGSDICPSVSVILTGYDFWLLTPGLSKIASVTLRDFSATLTGESYGYPTPPP